MIVKHFQAVIFDKHKIFKVFCCSSPSRFTVLRKLPQDLVARLVLAIKARLPTGAGSGTLARLLAFLIAHDRHDIQRKDCEDERENHNHDRTGEERLDAGAHIGAARQLHIHRRNQRHGVFD